MSYKIRKINRECADWLLEVLSRDYNTVVDQETHRYKMTDYQKKTLAEIMVLSNEQRTGFLIDDIERAVRILHRNHHVIYVYEPADLLNSTAVCTVEGEDAFDDSYYPVENRKDFLEGIEKYTKSILPLVSVLISIMALVISILGHSKK
jgi:hypothetical protein